MKKFIKGIMSLGVIAGLLLETFPVWALTKDESIYAKLENNGQVDKVIVSEHLQGTGEKETTDRTKLTDIQNINGNEKFTNDNGKLVWESNGKDIYYQGQTKEELPVTLKVSYYFNGEESTIANMLGKKGTVKIVLKYTNNDRHEELINGKYELLYTPFVVATTTILSNENNYNIKVTNGKVIANGTSSIVVLLSTPGLYESLKIDKLKGMDTAEITFDTDSFELSSIYSVSTPKLLDSSDLEIFNDVKSLYSSIDKLVDSSHQLKSGSNQLLDGANKLKEGVNKLKDGINSAYNGSKQITDGVSSKVELLNNSAALDQDTLLGIKTQSVAGAKQGVVDTFADNSYKASIANDAWTTVQQQMNPNDPDVAAIVTNAITSAIPSAVSASIQSAVTDAVSTAVTNYLTATNQLSDYTACEASEDKTIESCQNVDFTTLQLIKTAATTAATNAATTAATNAATTAATNASKTTASNVAAHVAENVSKGVSVTVAEETAKKTAEKVAGDISTLVATQVAEGAKKETINSLQTLITGLTQLTSGLYEINNGMTELDSGTSALKDGISALDSGISQFNTQGIDKISNLVNGDVKSLQGKLEALGRLSTRYGTFDDKENGTEGSTKIIMVIDGIKADTTAINKVEKIIDNKESIMDKIKEIINNNKKKSK